MLNVMAEGTRQRGRRKILVGLRQGNVVHDRS